MTLIKPLFLGAVLAVLLSTSASADARDDAPASIDAAMPAAVAKGFGGVILIEEKGKPIFEKSYGFADREKKIPFSPECRSTVELDLPH
jgi:CubicO group peptidase (beta-lactamase class C family)